MDLLLKELHSTLNNDSTLGNLVSSVRFFRRPEDPQKLVKPVVVFNTAPGSDEIDLHGAATNPRIEVDVWGYNRNDMAPDCVRAAQRISELMISTKFSLSRGGHLRWSEDQTFQTIPQEDPDVILMRATFGTRYWSGGRIDAIVANS